MNKKPEWVSHSTLLSIFKEKTIKANDITPDKYIKNPHYSCAPMMKLYLFSNILDAIVKGVPARLKNGLPEHYKARLEQAVLAAKLEAELSINKAPGKKARKL